MPAVMMVAIALLVCEHAHGAETAGELLNNCRSLEKGKSGLTGRARRGERNLKIGTVLVRDYQGRRHTVTVGPDGFVWEGTSYSSLSAIARAITGTVWNGPRFFAAKSAPGNDPPAPGRRRPRPPAETQPSARASQTSPR
jgi:hypothetical protein